MAPRRLIASPRAGEQLRSEFQSIRDELGVPREFGAAVLAEADAVATSSSSAATDLDMTDVPFVTVDPAGSKDLDQAMSLERTAHGYRVRYAIADVGGFVRPGGALDTEARVRGLTLYCPDTRVPLTPTVLSEGAASLLAGHERAAAVWTVELDAHGDEVSSEVRRARVRSRAQLSFEDAQRLVDAGNDDQMTLLKEVGTLRQERERARGGMSLTIAEQQVVARDGSYELAYRAPLPVEDWNAQMSLLTGAAAAGIMLRFGTGILRTMPPPGADDLERLRRTATALGIAWPAGMSYGDLVPTLDPALPVNTAFLTSAAVLLRGAGYTTFVDGAPERRDHAAVGGPYAHVTAPLRRLVDRFATAICLTACAGESAPDWVLAALPALPAEMATADRRAGELERACVSVVEAALLHDQVGRRYSAVVVDVRKDGSAQVQLAEPAVRARCEAGPTVKLGERIEVTLVEADPAARSVRFAPV